MTRPSGGAAGVALSVAEARGVGVGLGHSQNHSESTPSGTLAQNDGFDRDRIAEIVALIRAVHERSVAYRWPPISRALAQGRPVELTRRGRRMYLLHRSQFVAPIDTRAVEVELALRREVFEPAPETDKPEGLTITQAAKLIGVDRANLSKNLVEVPPGPTLQLPPGKVPCRVIGRTRRIFREDIIGAPGAHGEQRHGCYCKAQASGPASARGDAWSRQIADICES